jgi:hypothetical protein
VGYISLIPCRHHLGITHIPDEIHDLRRWIDWIRATAEFFYRNLAASNRGIELVDEKRNQNGEKAKARPRIIRRLRCML